MKGVKLVSFWEEGIQMNGAAYAFMSFISWVWKIKALADCQFASTSNKNSWYDYLYYYIKSRTFGVKLFISKITLM